ncbi:MAG: hypothetical protein KAT25_10320 [Sulfuriflexus sp.]|nr:hypothetical protein [Sulfuriflexus sp.]
MSKQQDYDLEQLSNANHSHGDKALEMIMRDVIDGMEDIANMAGYSPQPGSCFEVLEIIAEESESSQQEAPSADIVPIGRKSKKAVA